MSGESGQLVFVTAGPTGIQLRMERLQRSGCLLCALLHLMALG